MLTRYNPNQLGSRLSNRNVMNPWFGTFGREFDRLFGSAELPFFNATPAPHFDVERDENAVTVLAELPGLKRDELKVTLDAKKLTISGETKSDEENEGRREYRSYSFARSFTLSDRIDETAINAKLEDGILTLTLPYVPEEEPKQVEISVA